MNQRRKVLFFQPYCFDGFPRMPLPLMSVARMDGGASKHRSRRACAKTRSCARARYRSDTPSGIARSGHSQFERSS